MVRRVVVGIKLLTGFRSFAITKALKKEVT
jgi:hypothetical protein